MPQPRRGPVEPPAEVVVALLGQWLLIQPQEGVRSQFLGPRPVPHHPVEHRHDAPVILEEHPLEGGFSPCRLAMARHHHRLTYKLHIPGNARPPGIVTCFRGGSDSFGGRLRNPELGQPDWKALAPGRGGKAAFGVYRSSVMLIVTPARLGCQDRSRARTAPPHPSTTWCLLSRSSIHAESHSALVGSHRQITEPRTNFVVLSRQNQPVVRTRTYRQGASSTTCGDTFSTPPSEPGLAGRS